MGPIYKKFNCLSGNYDSKWHYSNIKSMIYKKLFQYLRGLYQKVVDKLHISKKSKERKYYIINGQNIVEVNAPTNFHDGYIRVRVAIDNAEPIMGLTVDDFEFNGDDRPKKMIEIHPGTYLPEY